MDQAIELLQNVPPASARLQRVPATVRTQPKIHFKGKAIN